MAQELIPHVTGRRVGLVFSRADGQRWRPGSSAFEAHVDANIAAYKVAAAEMGTSGDYLLTVPNTGESRLHWVAYDIADAGSALAIGDAKIAAGLWAEPLYHAAIDFTRDNSNARDEYTVRWYRNGLPLSSGVTAPQLTVKKRADGLDLVAATDLDPIGATGALKLDVTAYRLPVGEAAEAIATATIDGLTRTFGRLIGRDA